MRAAITWKHLAVAAIGLAASILPACTPDPGTVGPTSTPTASIVCDGGSGQLRVSPGVTTTARQVSYTLLGSSTTARCTDQTGAGITSAAFDRLTITFPSLSCFVTSGTSGAGTGRVVWSDGTVSNVSVVATLGGALDGVLQIRVTSGHLAGSSTSTNFVATPTEGDCFAAGITRESVGIEPMVITPAS